MAESNLDKEQQDKEDQKETKKPKKQGLLRLKGIIPFAMIFGGAFFLFVIFLNPFLKSLLQDYLEDENQAKVDISHFDLNPFNLSLEIEGVQWTDNQKYTNNLFEFGKVEFDMDTVALLSSKVHVETLEMTGLAFDTPREESGYLLRYGDKNKSATAGSSDDSAAADDMGGPFDRIDEFDPKKVMADYNFDYKEDAEKLTKDFDNVQKTITTKAEKAKDISSIKKKVDTVKAINVKGYNSPASIPQAKKDIETITALKKETTAKRQELKNIKAELQAEMKSSKEAYQAIKDEKAGGLKKLLSDYSLGGDGLKNITSLVFGDALTDKVYSYKTMFDQYSSYLPDASAASTNDKNETGSMRVKSRDIDFTGMGGKPEILFNEVLLSGDYKKYGITGYISNISSDLKYQPVKFDMGGTKSGSSIGINGYFSIDEKTGRHHYVKVKNNGAGLKDAGLFNNNKVIKNISRGTADTVLSIEIQEDKTVTRMDFTGNNVGFELNPMKNKTVQEILNKVLKDIRLFTFMLQITTMPGKGDRGDIKFKSNLDDILNKKLREYIKQKAAGKRKELIALYNKKAASFMGPLEDKLGVDLTGGLDGSIKSLDGFSSVLDSKKKELQDQIKKAGASKITDKLPIKKKPKLPF